MKSSCSTLAAILIGLAGPALARPNPQPPPSGIVVHLFGPGSITSNILPTARDFLPGGPAHGANMAGASAAAGGASIAPGGAATGNTGADDDPTMGQVLHQMFVVGDPNQKPGAAIAPGRAAEHPRVLNP